MNLDLMVSLAKKNKNLLIDHFVNLGMEKDQASLLVHADLLKVPKEKTMKILKIDEEELMKRYSAASENLKKALENGIQTDKGSDV